MLINTNEPLCLNLLFRNTKGSQIYMLASIYYLVLNLLGCTIFPSTNELHWVKSAYASDRTLNLLTSESNKRQDSTKNYQMHQKYRELEINMNPKNENIKNKKFPYLATHREK